MNKIGLYTNKISDSWLIETLAINEIEVVLVCNDEQVIYNIEQKVYQILDRKIQKWLITEAEKKVILSRIEFQKSTEKLDDLQLFIDAVSGDIEEKKQRITHLDSVVSKSTIIGIHTSAYRVTDLQSISNYPERIVGLHFNRHAIEMIKGKKTNQQTICAITKLSKHLRKRLINEVESPGNVYKRLELIVINEAFDIVAEGITSLEELEALICARFNIKMGPLERADRIGLDIVLLELDELYKVTKNKKFKASTYLRTLVSSGRIGVQSGEGVFKYDKDGQSILNKQGVK